MNMQSLSVVFGTLAFACTTLSCTRGNRPVQSPPPEVAPVEPPVFPQPPPNPNERVLRLDIGEDLDACPLAQPHFAYDRETSRLMDSGELAEFAECLNKPGMRDVHLLLVGRTDPVGPSEYNQELGTERAQHVKNKLVDYGVDGDRIQIRSAGESGATPEDSRPDGYDRRVDIVQLNIVRAPEGSERSLVGDH